MCQEIEMEITMADGSALPTTFTFSYDSNTRSGSLTVETLDESLVGVIELKAVAWYQAYTAARVEKTFTVEVVAKY